MNLNDKNAPADPDERQQQPASRSKEADAPDGSGPRPLDRIEDRMNNGEIGAGLKKEESGNSE